MVAAQLEQRATNIRRHFKRNLKSFAEVLCDFSFFSACDSLQPCYPASAFLPDSFKDSSKPGCLLPLQERSQSLF